ncbi:MAG: lasso peptide biosynthesis B2 protein [Actinomycetota bacterium]
MSPALQLRALAAVVASRVLLSRGTTTDALRRLTRRGTKKSLDPLTALMAVRRAARIAGGACLPQAVALTALLDRAGFAPVLVLGSHLDAKRQWTAHAWVEADRFVLEPVITVEHEPLANLTATNGWTPSPPKADRVNRIVD